MIAKDRVTEIFCIADDFCKEFDKEVSKMGLESPKKACQRNQTWRMSRSKIMTTLICFHLGSFHNPQALLPVLCKGTHCGPVAWQTPGTMAHSISQ